MDILSFWIHLDFWKVLAKQPNNCTVKMVQKVFPINTALASLPTWSFTKLNSGTVSYMGTGINFNEYYHRIKVSTARIWIFKNSIKLSSLKNNTENLVTDKQIHQKPRCWTFCSASMSLPDILKMPFSSRLEVRLLLRLTRCFWSQMLDSSSRK